MVGCVIVAENQIIGEGFTSPYGGPHAEVNAINSVKDKALLSKSTLYVTLEPCNHHGKTPPCSDYIIKHKIPKIVIGCSDQHEKVNGKGIERLKGAGCEVLVGILEKECQNHHARFFTFHTKNRPYIILKWAESKDGFIAPKTKTNNRPFWISNSISQQLVHQWRSEEQAIVIGAKTVIEDNPRLTTRHVKGSNPIRVVIDTHGNLNKNYSVFDHSSETFVFSKKHITKNQPIGQLLCDFLHEKQITSAIIEGGSKTLQMFIDENLWDEARVFVGETELNDGIKSPKFNTTPIYQKTIKGDILKYYKND